MDFRKTFDKIPESFDKYRPRYCKALFQELEMICGLNPEKKVLEIGPGTGQATEPILKTGCDYTAIELGENFASLMQDKFGCYQNFHIINADLRNIVLMKIYMISYIRLLQYNGFQRKSHLRKHIGC